jgi:signal transduction histidine kinase
MNTIIWTMVSSNDTVESLVAYIRAYAVEFFENTSIDCQFNLPMQMPSLDLSGEKRRNVFLSVKEALNNVLKHSQASIVRIEISISNKLIIEIADNGVGINMDQLRKFGNGLQNMKKRIASIGGDLLISNNGGGTKTIFELEFD